MALISLTSCKRLFNACRRSSKQDLQQISEGAHNYHLYEGVKLKLEELGGIDALEALQLGSSQEVYERAQKLLVANFEEDLNQSLGPLASLFASAI